MIQLFGTHKHQTLHNEKRAKYDGKIIIYYLCSLKNALMEQVKRDHETRQVARVSSRNRTTSQSTSTHAHTHTDR